MKLSAQLVWRRLGIVRAQAAAFAAGALSVLILVAVFAQMARPATTQAAQPAQARQLATLLDTSGHGDGTTGWASFKAGEMRLTLHHLGSGEAMVLLQHQALQLPPETVLESTSTGRYVKSVVVFTVPSAAEYAVKVRASGKWRIVIQQ